MRWSIIRRCAWPALAVLLLGCSTSVGERVHGAETQLLVENFEPLELGPDIPVRVWAREEPAAGNGAPWHLYLEGDGAAWRRGGVPTLNPTPQVPVALELAVADASPRVAYVARPCQFHDVLPRACRPPLWTDERYGVQVQQWLLQAFEAVAGEEPLRIVGFSGGAHLALQLAPGLDNVVGVVSVAGNLDDAEFAKHHALPKPRHVPPKGDDLPLWSYSGEGDRIVPPRLTERMLQARGGACQFHQVVAGAGHDGPWRIDWPEIEAFLAGCQYAATESSR
ncbi:hypothetical protein [Billgrantia kenyensis]|uniref:Uncharacterized protein n=1 Tax=Billgrantia kenyensis TaxID=321266 RepID=A0A7W0ADY8_9GAMM|nr:hypothetical protein [Halomonas kenyensis]MBA2779005.1 hypothetical protein [Halomonas kenyensis]MCG6662932.1 hypothetical protein [Halomonas kenyensis]